MDSHRTSPTRTKATWKPRVHPDDPRLLHAEDATLLLLDQGHEASYLEPGRSPVAALPYQANPASPDGVREDQGTADSSDAPSRALGAGEPTPSPTPNASALPGLPGLEEVALLDVDQLPAGIQLDYAITGGYDANAVEVRWRIDAGATGADGQPLALRWVMLKTFTGLQVKYLLPGKRPPLVFALADEDAYVYCDEPLCKECTFRCKQGFALYAAFDGLGTVRLPLMPNRR